MASSLDFPLAFGHRHGITPKWGIGYFLGRVCDLWQRLQRVTSELSLAPHLGQRRAFVCFVNLVRGRTIESFLFLVVQGKPIVYSIPQVFSTPNPPTEQDRRQESRMQPPLLRTLGKKWENGSRAVSFLWKRLALPDAMGPGEWPNGIRNSFFN